MVAKVESISGSKNGWGFEYRLPSSKAVTSLCHPLELETRKDGLRYSTVMFISSGFLKTLRAFSSLHLFCRMCNFSVEYGGRRPFLCGGCVGPMLIFTSNSLALPLSILNWGLNRESWSLRALQNNCWASSVSIWSGLTFTVSEWRTVLCSKVAEAGKELDTVSLVLFDTGIVGRTWQKCSFLLSCLVSLYYLQCEFFLIYLDNFWSMSHVFCTPWFNTGFNSHCILCWDVFWHVKLKVWSRPCCGRWGLNNICMSSPNVVLLISFPSIVMDDVGVASYNGLGDTDIISRQKLDSCY